MLLYLDVCSLQRPWDDRSQLRIRVEAEAVLGILSRCDAGGAELLSSDALLSEARKNPDPARRSNVLDILARAFDTIPLTDPIEVRAGELVAAGLGPYDALHLASAAARGADYFCTCDDRLLRRGRAAQTPPPKIVSPLELATELGL